jgi:hypothetical protein
LRRIDLEAAGGLRLIGYLADAAPSDVRLVQAHDPRDERTPLERPRPVFFVRTGGPGSLFIAEPVYGLVHGPEVPQ